MSSSTSALKASKSIVDSYVSSTERSDLTTSFTENTPTLSNTGLKKTIIQTILGIVKHPKFKWMVIAVLLCICVFVYFKSQNRQTKQANKEQIEDTRLDIAKDKDGRPILVDLKEKEYMDKISQMEQREKQLHEKINQMNSNNMRSNNNQQSKQHQDMHAIQQAQQAQQAAAFHRAQQEAEAQRVHRARQEAEAQRAQQPTFHRESESESESSDEVFIENENVMNHNLTREEMNAIDKQLEDININNMGYESN
jgi:hypothetical protein